MRRLCPSLHPAAGLNSPFYYLHAQSSVIDLCGEQVVDSTAELLNFVHTASTALDIDVTEKNKDYQPAPAQVSHHTPHLPPCH